jgi:hypothetical protein
MVASEAINWQRKTAAAMNEGERMRGRRPLWQKSTTVALHFWRLMELQGEKLNE